MNITPDAEAEEEEEEYRHRVPNHDLGPATNWCQDEDDVTIGWPSV
jgi:hypothetical protein